MHVGLAVEIIISLIHDYYRITAGFYDLFNFFNRKSLTCRITGIGELQIIRFFSLDSCNEVLQRNESVFTFFYFNGFT